nr:segregation/condensation protein A [Flavobacterium sp.]
MINTIIFDFGDIFINLDKEAPRVAFAKLGLKTWSEDLEELNLSFEKGKISELQFIEGFQKKIPDVSIKEIRSAWNTILLDFPLYRLEFLQMLSQKYRLFLLSNTDSIHINRFQEYIRLMAILNLEVAGEFMVMASTLIHIKSKMLVPVSPPS